MPTKQQSIQLQTHDIAMKRIFVFIDQLHNVRILQLFTIYLRLLIGGTFVFAFTWKAEIGMDYDVSRFTQNSLSPAFAFQAFMRIKALWMGVSLAQLIGGGLLATQRFASLGALLLMPVVIPIVLITWDIGFAGTREVTLLLLLGVLYLLAWDIKKFWLLFKREDHIHVNYTGNPQPFIHHWWWTATGIAISIASIIPYWTHSRIAWLVSCLLIGLLSLVLHQQVIKRTR